MSVPLIEAIIINFERDHDTLECLASLRRSTYPINEIILLNRSSKNGMGEIFSRRCPNLRVVPLIQNLGYAGNNNIGIKLALHREADWILLLNDDTVVDPNCLLHLVEVGESDPRIGIVGPMVYHYNEPNVIQSAGGMFGPNWESIHLAKNEDDIGQYKNPHDVEWISGCAIMIRASAVIQAGLLDERFFNYWEETEWCRRITDVGWRVVHVPQAKIWHKGVQREYFPNPSVTYYSTRNRLLMYAKHHAPLHVWLFAWLQILRTLISWTIMPKWRAQKAHRDAMWQGLVDFLRRRWGPMSS